MRDTHLASSLLGNAILLSADRFTPLTRTPWAGQDISKSYKRDVITRESSRWIGESWEFSCDPSFPSLVLGADMTLSELIETFPEQVLSPALAKRFGPQSDILIKLINAAEPLSFQVHPADDYPSLLADECGKPESWLILQAQPHAGIYLGFSRAIAPDDLKAILQRGDEAKSLLQFVPVKPGDYFEIAPGVPHAIGPGVTILEPQRLCPGKSGKTYRLWDWGRRYNAEGKVDQLAGESRELHLEEAMPLIDPMTQVGEDFVAKAKRSSSKQRLVGGVEHFSYPANTYYQVHRFHFSAGQELKLAVDDGYGALIPLSGSVMSRGANGQLVQLKKGHPALLPASAMPLHLTAEDQADLVLVVPASARFINF